MRHKWARKEDVESNMVTRRRKEGGQRSVEKEPVRKDK